MSVETIILIIVLFIMLVAMAVIKSISKSGKNNNRARADRKEAMRVRLEGRTSEDPFADPLKPEEIKVETAPVRKYVAPAKAVPKATKPAFGKGVDGTDLIEAAPKVHTSARVVGVTKSHHDEHCDVEHSDDDLYIVEKVPVSGSIGGRSDEGCGEHYNLRFVKIEKDDGNDGKIALSPDEIRKAIILGEVLNDPAFKK